MGSRYREAIKEELGVNNFSLECRTPQVFVQFQWGCRGYVWWRVVSAVLCVSLVGVSVHLSGQYSGELQHKWVIYLANWSLLLLTLSSLVDLASNLYVHHRRQDIVAGVFRSMPWYLKLSWVLYNASHPTALLVSTLYWLIVYKAGQTFQDYHILPLLSHGVNSLHVLINILVTAIPSRVFHFTHVLTVGVAYVLFTAVYAAAGGTSTEGKTYIYHQLDWTHPRQTVLVSLGVLMAALLFHLLVFGLTVLRQRIADVCVKTQTSVILDSPKIYRKVFGRKSHFQNLSEFHL